MRNTYSSQIARIDGKNVFVEVLNGAFSIGKLQMNFIEYDEQTNKQTKKLDMYIDALLAVSLAERILNGEFQRYVAEVKASGKATQWTSYFTDMGGVSEDKVAAKFDEFAEKYPFLKKGDAISRQLKVQTGNKYPWVLLCMRPICRITVYKTVNLCGITLLPCNYSDCFVYLLCLCI